MKLLSVFGVMAILCLFSFKLIDNSEKVKDYFTILGSVEYNKTMYNLSWSDHPNSNYFKQEYIPATEKPETFRKMIMIEAVVGDISLRDAVKSKIDELEQRKKTDPVTNYQVIENKQKGEYILDFVVSQSNNKQSIVEWNAYRYLKLKDKSGNKGIMLFAYCRRGYNAGTTNFLKSLKTERLADINSFAAFNVPGVQIDR